MTKPLTKQLIRELLLSRFEKDIHTKLSLIPSPMEFKDMKKAALRIKKAWKRGEDLVIVGDYDADGVIASCILSEFFDKMGMKYDIYIPNRFLDGYGLNAQIVEKVDANLIVTVDNGITAIEAGEICEKKGIDLIITDHHSVPEVLPKAYAVVNPKQDDCSFAYSEICGAQVAWYLCAAIKEVCALECDLSVWFDFLAIAIMADMMELRDLNRVMVKRGLRSLNRTNRPAFLAIRDMFGKDNFGSDDISFLIAPLINSAGRMDDAKLSYDFLRSKDYNEAIFLLEKVADLNNLRKKQESNLYENSLDMVNSNKKIIVVWGKNWHEGVVGIVASRLSRHFKRPAIVFSSDGEVAKGSARSVGEIDILSIIAKHSDLLLGYGGHKGAAGISIEVKNLHIFREALERECQNIDDKLFHSNKEVLGEIIPSEIDFELLEILKSFEPYGLKNPRPSFIIKQVYVKSTRIIGKEQNHLKLILKYKNVTLESLFFNFDRPIKNGELIDIIFTISKNDYRGLVTPQLFIKSIL